MSGISGIVYLDGRQVRDSDLKPMTDAMAHRGRDGRGMSSVGSAGLAHCMLHTTPESLTERLPLVNVYGRYSLTADARIDNRDDLIVQLALPRRNPGYADSELIAFAYARWGDDCVDHLLGDFAFALWDEMEQTLFCARDHFGMKPFYYYFRPGHFLVFASEIKALHAVDGVPAELNESWIINQLIGTADTRETVYEDIFRLPPAHTLSLRHNRMRVNRYWMLAPSESALRYSDHEYVARFKELFEEAVACRVRSAFPVGSELSGGLDSSYVSCVARDVLRDRGSGSLATFSHVFDAVPAADETSYIRAVLATGGFVPHFLAGDRVGPLSMIDSVYESVLDDFLVSATHYLVWESHRAAADTGVRILLNGLDGDSTVEHGDLYLRELARMGRWEEFGREVDSSAALHSADKQRHEFQDVLSSREQMLRSYGYPQLEEDARSGRWFAFASGVQGIGRHFGVKRRRIVRHYWRQLLRRPGQGARSPAQTLDRPPAVPKYVAASAVGQFDVTGRLEHLQQTEKNLFRSVRDKQLVRLSRPRLAGGFEALNHYAAHFGIESRSPFMDVRLITFCLGLPSDQSFRNGWTRHILRRAMKGTVPDAIVLRVGKALMSDAFRHSVLEVDDERLVRSLAETQQLSGFIDQDFVLDQSRRRRSLPDRDLNQLVRIGILSRWLNIRFSGRTQEQEIQSMAAV